MKSLTVKAQLSLLTTFFVTMLLLSSAISLYFLSQTVGGLKTVYEDRVVPIKQLRVVADMYAVNIVDTVHKVRDGALTKAQGLSAIGQARTQIKTEWLAYTGTFLVPQETELIAKAKPLFVQADQAVDRAEALFTSNDPQAQATLTAYAAHDMYPMLDPLQGVISDLIQVQLDVSKAVYEEGVAANRLALMAVVGFAALAVLIGGLLAFRLTYKLVSALGAEPDEVKAMVQAVERGELFNHVTLRPHDQTSVAACIKAMTSTLRSMVQTTRENADSVAAASLQISQANLDLSNRTERQASALEETAASMEEINSIVRLNADNACEAASLAQSACGIATTGTGAVAEVEKTMKHIHEASQHIAQIINVMDGIAFQTNILALNAAVEAARAGDQGRGFAVVAGEVRQLSLRSADAAKQIKSLVATSNDRVQQGATLTAQAADTMRHILQANTKVASIMAEISAASKEQTLGVNQVSEAIADIDQITQQNAALVEESSAAALSLKDQAHSLVNAVAVFRMTAQESVVTQESLSPAHEYSTSSHQETTSHAVARPVRGNTTTNTWKGAERRSPNRAKNIVRPHFGTTPSADKLSQHRLDREATGTYGA